MKEDIIEGEALTSACVPVQPLPAPCVCGRGLPWKMGTDWPEFLVFLFLSSLCPGAEEAGVSLTTGPTRAIPPLCTSRLAPAFPAST